MAEIFTADELRAQLRASGVPAELIERAVAGRGGAPCTEPLPSLGHIAEKQLVALADKQLRALGFTVWNLSQARASKIAAGVPDRLYTHLERGLALFWEAKTEDGKQRPDQRIFEEHTTAAGWNYALGTDRQLFDWLVARYPLRWDESGHLVWSDR